MIAVIADDFTGAAEIGGIALRLGWNAIIDTCVSTGYQTEVLIIATNTRSKPPAEARIIIRELTLQLLSLQPTIIYKKIDSVLRGNVGEELLEQMLVSGKKRALLIPANPSLGRVVSGGIYYYEGVPLQQSTFSNARHRISSSKVIDLIGKPSEKNTVIISNGDVIPATGLVVGNTIDETDLDHWAGRLDDETIMAGGSSFFKALLKKIRQRDQQNDKTCFAFGEKTIYVCGSAFPLSRNVVEDARNAGQYVAYMPSQLFLKPQDKELFMQHWKEDILRGVYESGSVIIAIDKIDGPKVENLSSALSKAIATVVSDVMQCVKVEELVIEGGATASAIIDQLEYKKFYPVQELAPGVIRMKVEENKDVHLTMKPGSYTWPSSIWKY